jgi:hypothetical protein
MRRRRLHILIAVMVLAFCRLLHDESVTLAPAMEIARVEEHPTTAPLEASTNKQEGLPSWDWLFVRAPQSVDTPDDGGGESTDLAKLVMPTMRGWTRVFVLPDAPDLWNRPRQTDEALRLVGGFFDDHFKSPPVPWIDPPVSPKPHSEDAPQTSGILPAPGPALTVRSDPLPFNDSPSPAVIPPPAPVGGTSSPPPTSGPVSLPPVPEPNGILLPMLILLGTRRFHARG